MTLPLIHDLLASGPISVAADTTLKATILLKFESEQACDDWVIRAGDSVPFLPTDHIEQRDALEQQAIVVTVPRLAKLTGTIDLEAFPDADRVKLSSNEVLHDYDYTVITLKASQTNFEFAIILPGKYEVFLIGSKPIDRNGVVQQSPILATCRFTLKEGETANIQINE